MDRQIDSDHRRRAGGRRAVRVRGLAAVAARLLFASALLLIPVAVILGRQVPPGSFGPIAAAEAPMTVEVCGPEYGAGPDLFVDPRTGREVVPALTAGGELRWSA